MTNNVATTPEPAKPISQEKKPKSNSIFFLLDRNRWPTWVQQLPRFKLPESKDNFELLDNQDYINNILNKVTPAARERILADKQTLAEELMPLFRERDREAKVFQNRHRLYQIGYIVLATLATIIGSFQALSVSAKPELVPWLAFMETIIALYATYLATISRNEPPFENWLINRRRAEALRREYFRFLTNAAPYNNLEEGDRQQMLAVRAAKLNMGDNVDGGQN